MSQTEESEVYQEFYSIQQNMALNWVLTGRGFLLEVRSNGNQQNFGFTGDILV